MNKIYEAEVKKWAEWIALPPEAIASLVATAATKPARLIDASRMALAKGEQPPDGASAPTVAVAALLALSDMVENHRARGISHAISQATATDITYWMIDHHRSSGEWGFSETNWIRRHTSGQLLRLGRLQYIPTRNELPVFPGVPVQPGDTILAVHIPAGEPLTPAACAHSFVAAREVFAEQTWVGFTCESWLLAPRLAEVLPETSNILAFQRFFMPLPSAAGDRQTIERVFGTWPLKPDKAPRTTALQRAVIDFYSRGGRLDGGAGFIPR